MALENAHDFTGYEPTTVDPGGRLTAIVVIVCILVNLSLPLMVRLASAFDRRKANDKDDAILAGGHAEAEHRDQRSVISKPTNTGSQIPPSSPLSIYQVATRTSSSEGSYHATPSILSEGVNSVFTTRSTASSTVLSLAASAILDQRLSRHPRRRKKYRVDLQLSPSHSASRPGMIDDYDNDNDDASACSKSVMSVLDHDAVSIQDAVDARDGQIMNANSPKLLEQDEPSSLWEQFLEIVDWEAESKRLTVLTIPYTIQGCTEGIFQTINVAVIGHFLGVMEANAYVVVTILLEFSQTITYGFGEGRRIVVEIVPHCLL